MKTLVLAVVMVGLVAVAKDPKAGVKSNNNGNAQGSETNRQHDPAATSTVTATTAPQPVINHETNTVDPKAAPHDTRPPNTGPAEKFWLNLQFWFNLLLVIFTGLLALLAHRQLKAMHRQADLMSGQLAEMKTTSEDTHALAAAADSAAKAAEAQAQFAQRSVDAVFQQNAILSGQTQALIESANAAKENADSTRQMLNTMDRAWVSAKVKCTNFEFGSDGTLFLFFHIILENVGRTVANRLQLRTRTSFTLPDEIDRFEQPIAAQDAMIADPDDGSSIAMTLFPNNPTLIPASNFVSEAGYRTRAFRDDSDVMRLEPVFVGVVLYQYPHSAIVHKTRFAYEIKWHNSDAVVPEFPQLPIAGQTIRPQDILFSPFLFGGHDAD